MALIAASTNASAQDNLSAAEATDLPRYAWLFGLPLVMFEKQIDYSTYVTQADQNCLEVTAGPFDVAARYYLPEPEIMKGEWTMPHPARVKSD